MGEVVLFHFDDLMKKYFLEGVVFLCGAVVMVLELTGSRILAPYVGMSLYVWTSLIGVMLGFLSIGYSLGGKLADKHTSLKEFAFLLFVGGAAVGLTAFIKDPILRIFIHLQWDLRSEALVASILLFGLPSLLLGMVSPYAIRLKMKSIDSSGKTVGNLYALSTLGSIFGTFLSGFYLMALLGSHYTLFVLAIVLILLSLSVSWQNWKKSFLVILILGGGIFFAAQSEAQARKIGFIDFDSAYNRIIVANTVDDATGRPIRIYANDAEGTQSAQFTDKDNDLVFEYAKFYRLVQHFVPQPQQALVIGGGMFSYPRDFLKHFPTSTVDVVEIDPELQTVAKKYFGLVDDPRFHIYHEDGRTFLNGNDKKYDAIFVDAFHSISPPFQLNTKEAIQKMSDSLNSNGAVLVNVVSALEGKNSLLLQATKKTYEQIFPQIFVFQVHSKEVSTNRQNILLVALKSAAPVSLMSTNEEMKKYLQNVWTKEVSNQVPILTDDFAPVEWYSMKGM